MAHHQTIRKQTPAPRADGAAPVSSDIPDKLYFRIGEVARLCEVPAYVLRFWESEFPQLKPNKGGTGQRLFRRRDVEMALRIKRLLYDEGYTIPGARQLLKVEARQKEPQLTLLSDDAPKREGRDLRLRGLRQDLHALLLLLQTAPTAPSAEAGKTFGSSSRQTISAQASRRASLTPVPARETLFDLAGSISPQVDRQELEEDHHDR